MVAKDKEFYVPGDVIGTDDGFVKLTVDAVGEGGTIYFVDSAGNEYSFDTDEFAHLRKQKRVVTAGEASSAPTELTDILQTLSDYRSTTSNPWVNERLSDAQLAVFEAIVEEIS